MFHEHRLTNGEKKKKSLNLYSRQSLCFLQTGKSEGQGNGLEIRATKKRGRAKRILGSPWVWFCGAVQGGPRHPFHLRDQPACPAEGFLASFLHFVPLTQQTSTLKLKIQKDFIHLTNMALNQKEVSGSFPSALWPL